MVTWQIAQLAPGESIALQMVVYALDYYSLSSSSVPADASVLASVLGGITATVGTWPWQAAIVDASAPDDYTGQYCGGTLIELDWVLTAGSCVAGYSPSELAVVLGRHELSSSEGQRFDVAEIVLHPDYDVIQKGVAKGAIFIDLNDLAVLRLSTSPVLDDRVSPIARATPAQASAVVSGTSAVEGALSCSRCLEEGAWQDSDTFSVRYRVGPLTPRGDEEVGLEEEDLEVVFVGDGELDLSELAAEQIVLGLPMRWVCDEACRGLCPQCGANLNRENACTCEPETDPRWQALADLANVNKS